MVSLTFDLESGIQITCDVGYLYTNIGLPRPLHSRLRPDVRNRQTDVRQNHHLMPSPIRGGGIITETVQLHMRGYCPQQATKASANGLQCGLLGMEVQIEF